MARVSQGRVSLLRWLRRQLAQPMAVRERLEAAVANDDPGEARRLLGLFEFSAAQRHHVDGLLKAWEREVRDDETARAARPESGGTSSPDSPRTADTPPPT